MRQKLQLVPLDKHNVQAFNNLVQAYCAEFSEYTHKLPDTKGSFTLNTPPVAPYTGFLLYDQQIPIGFTVIKIDPVLNDVAEFYVIPSMRKKQIGYEVAKDLFDSYPGTWQVRQIEGAHPAIAFWRKAIERYTNHRFEEVRIQDQKWGAITCQRFSSRNLSK